MGDPIALACSLSRRRCWLWLDAVIALGNHEIALRMRQAQRFGPLVFGRAVAGERSGVVRKFAQNVAGTGAAFYHLAGPTPHQRPPSILVVGGRRGGHVGLVAFQISHIEVRNPVSLGHLDFPGTRRHGATAV
jgi:hypothetical protein